MRSDRWWVQRDLRPASALWCGEEVGLARALRWHLTDTQNPRSVSSRRRSRRDRKFLIPFLEAVFRDAQHPLRLLDVGGRAAYWLNNGLADDRRLAGVVITNFEEDIETPAHPNMSYVRDVDARALPYDDGAFDVVFSNSVIEHVGVRTDQGQMVSELIRVGHAVFLQTPNKWFPLEPHFFGVPYFQFLPIAARGWLLATLPLAQAGRIRPYERACQVASEVHLLGARELRQLASAAGADCTIRKERFLGLPKSLIMLMRRR